MNSIISCGEFGRTNGLIHWQESSTSAGTPSSEADISTMPSPTFWFTFLVGWIATLSFLRLNGFDQISIPASRMPFSGLSEEEAAEVLGVSRLTVIRDWNLARAWLGTELKRID
jgi:hypothetical protein